MKKPIKTKYIVVPVAFILFYMMSGFLSSNKNFDASYINKNNESFKELKLSIK